MSTEVFPCSALKAVDIIDKPLEGFRWERSRRRPEDDNVRLLFRGNDCTTVYAGNGPFALDRGYRPDAVWFEVFGMGMSWERAGAFFDALGNVLDCDFVTELGEEVTEGDENWDDELRDDAIRAMQRAPGSTSRFFKRPSASEPGYDPEVGHEFKQYGFGADGITPLVCPYCDLKAQATESPEGAVTLTFYDAAAGTWSDKMPACVGDDDE